MRRKPEPVKDVGTRTTNAREGVSHKKKGSDHFERNPSSIRSRYGY